MESTLRLFQLIFKFRTLIQLSAEIDLMLMPIKEIQESSNHYEFKTAYDMALEYQLEKVTFLINKMGALLDKQESKPYFYSNDKDFDYSLDALINNLSTLTEYYHGWVVFSHIGTTTHCKIKYSPLKNDKNINENIDKIFKENSIGVLKSVNNYNGNFYDDCKKAFINSFEFLFVGKFYEIYVLNNYIKHNMFAMGYAPKVIYNNSQISIPYVYIEKPFDCLLNKSVYKCLFEHKLDRNGVITSKTNDYFVDIINSTTRPICTMGGLNVYNINSIDYLVGEKLVGLSIESIVDMAQELTRCIVNVCMDSFQREVTRKNKFNSILNSSAIRKPKTLNNLIY